MASPVEVAVDITAAVEPVVVQATVTAAWE
jgi:hypothetical protein